MGTGTGVGDNQALGPTGSVREDEHHARTVPTKFSDDVVAVARARA